MLGADDLPYAMPTGPQLEDVTPRETFEAALAAIDYQGFARRQAEARHRAGTSASASAT